MSMRRGVAVTFGLVGACLYALLAAEAAKGEENVTEDFSFVQEVKLTEGTEVAEDQFGSSVAIDGNTVLIGVPVDDEKGSAAGAVYVFHRNDEGVWQEVQKLTASNGAANNFFGTSVGLSGDLALVGARGAAPKGSFSGAVYVFARGTDGVWNEIRILDASDGAAGNFFGWSVAVSGATAVVGARGNGDDPNFPGAVYVFVQEADGQWTQQQKLTAKDGEGGDEFGFSVALLDDNVLIGAPGESEKGTFTGAAYLFAREAGGQWEQRQKLTSDDGASGDEFGSGVAFFENTAVIGARFAEGVQTHAGAVYVYGPETESSETLWKETHKLTAKDGQSGDEFGGSVAASDKAIIVGAREAAVNGSKVGAVYVFARAQGSDPSVPWTELQRLTAEDGAGGDAFGASVALRDGSAIVGSPLDDLTLEADETDTTSTFTNSGSAYVLTMTSFPAACASKTDYEDAECSDTFFAASLTDLDAYVAGDFGRTDNDGKYKDLNITASLSDAVLILQSPCEIILDPGLTLVGDFVNIDGRKGVSGERPRIKAKKICVLSEQGNVSPGDEASIEVGALTLQAGEGAIIGDDAVVTVYGALTVEAVGDAESSAAVIDSGAVVNAGSVQIKSLHAVQIRDQARLSVDGVLSLVSTQDNSESEAIVGEAVQIQATDLTILSPRKAEIDKSASIKLFGDGKLVSGNEAIINKNVTLNVTGNFFMEAGSAEQCEIKDAQISAGTTSGNCF